MVLQMKGIVKNYPGVQALKKVDFDVREGEVHALVGENGAGKSTLMKILAGADTMDTGEIFLYGKPVTIDSPLRAQEWGISIIYQEFNLVPQLGAAENIFLGREPTCFGFVHFQQEKKQAEQLLERLGISLDLETPIQNLSIAQQQMVEIAKAISVDARVIAMDEPSATLTTHELQNLFSLIRTLRDQGVGVIYISHRLEEIFEVCDRLTVLRDGERIGCHEVEGLTRNEIIEMMVGRKITDEFPKETFLPGKEILRVEGLSRGFVHDISFHIREREIVALTGLVGAGRTEVARMIFGADQPDEGTITFQGETIKIASPKDAIHKGICLLTEDRKNHGLILGMKVRENITLPTLREFCHMLFVQTRLEKEQAQKSMDELRIKAPSTETDIRHLSGGNQQKVVLAKWLLAHSELFIFDEPTRGIDVGAKREIYLLMNELLRRGAGILMISSELPEVVGMADRILIMNRGYLVGELHHEEASQERIMERATQVPQNREQVA